MLKENDDIRTIINLWPYYKLGCYGQNINCASFEQQEVGHGYQVAAVFRDFAPQANLISLDGIYDKYQFILDNNIILAARSIELKDGQKPTNLNFPDDLTEHCLLLHAMGNDGARVDNTLVDEPEWFGTAAISKTDLSRVNYSNMSDDLLISAPGTAYYKTKGGTAMPDMGTSYTNYIIMAGLSVFCSFAVYVLGRALTGYEMVEMIIKFATPTEAPGFDVKTGHGVFRLPDPDVGEQWLRNLGNQNGGDPVVEQDIYKTIDDVPVYWQQDIRELIAAGAVNGGTDNSINDQDVNLTASETKVAVILKRYVDSKIK
jgi:hypothetical protein